MDKKLSYYEYVQNCIYDFCDDCKYNCEVCYKIYLKGE
jgi:hypothetical protein